MPETVRIYIKERREALGISQAELAKLLGVTSAAVFYWETGQSVPGAARLLKIAQVLRCSADDLFRPARIKVG